MNTSALYQIPSTNEAVVPREIGTSLFYYANRRIVIGESGKNVKLTAEENLFLSILVEADGTTVSKQELYKGIYDSRRTLPGVKIVEVVICNIRKKLKSLTEDGDGYIGTVWGKGYYLSPSPVDRSTLHTGKRGKTEGVIRAAKNFRNELRKQA